MSSPMVRKIAGIGVLNARGGHRSNGGTEVLAGNPPPKTHKLHCLTLPLAMPLELRASIIAARSDTRSAVGDFLSAELAGSPAITWIAITYGDDLQFHVGHRHPPAF